MQRPSGTSLFESDPKLADLFRTRVVEDDETDKLRIVMFCGECEEVDGATVDMYVSHGCDLGLWAGHRGLPVYAFYEGDLNQFGIPELPWSGALIAGKPEDIEAYLLTLATQDPDD
jgi:hypothetical protein